MQGLLPPHPHPFYFILHLLYDVIFIPLRGVEFRGCG
jgi:hypothetical protein